MLKIKEVEWKTILFFSVLCMFKSVLGKIATSHNSVADFLTEKIKDLGNCLTAVDVTIAISHMKIQFTFLCKLTNYVTIMVSTDVRSCAKIPNFFISEKYLHCHTSMSMQHVRRSGMLLHLLTI